jgi:hypothetical protein
VPSRRQIIFRLVLVERFRFSLLKSPGSLHCSAGFVFRSLQEPPVHGGRESDVHDPGDVSNRVEQGRGREA